MNFIDCRMVCYRATPYSCTLAKAASEAQGRGGCEIPADGSDISPEPHIYRTQIPSTGPRGSCPRVSATSLGIAPLRTSQKEHALTHAMHTTQDAFFFDGGRDFFFFDEPPPPLRRR